MSGHLGGNIHYRCTFDLVPKDDNEEQWGYIVRMVRNWIARRKGADDILGQGWFFRGGDWTSESDKRFSIITRSEAGDGTNDAPQYWAIRYSHACDEVSQRQWITDIGVTRLGEARYRFVLTIVHRLSTYYIGDESAPMPSTPGIVHTILDSQHWQALSGQERLSAHPLTLRPGDGKSFAERLPDLDRFCPIVLVTVDFDSKAPLVDCEKLARLLRGTANVYQASSSEVDKELEHYLPKAFRCWNGRVRVYQRGVQFDVEGDSRRHRYFNGDDIEAQTPDEVIRKIVTGIARRGPHRVGPVVATIEDVAAQHRRLRIAQLRENTKDEGAQEMLQLFETENEILEGSIKEKEAETERLQNEFDELEKANATLKYSDNSQRLTVQKLTVQNNDLKRRFGVFDKIRDLPQSVAEVVDIMEHFYAGRLEFTEDAKKSAATWTNLDAKIAWSCIYDMGTILYDLYFNRDADNVDIESEFNSRSTFELTLREGKMTRRDKKLMAMRRRMWMGKEIDIEPHVKFGKKAPKLLRVHFCRDSERKILVVAHCGDHIENYSSRTR